MPFHREAGRGRQGQDALHVEPVPGGHRGESRPPAGRWPGAQTPTTSGPAPTAKRISVMEGERLTQRAGAVGLDRGGLVQASKRRPSGQGAGELGSWGAGDKRRERGRARTAGGDETNSCMRRDEASEARDARPVRPFRLPPSALPLETKKRASRKPPIVHRGFGARASDLPPSRGPLVHPSGRSPGSRVILLAAPSHPVSRAVAYYRFRRRSQWRGRGRFSRPSLFTPVGAPWMGRTSVMSCEFWVLS